MLKALYPLNGVILPFFMYPSLKIDLETGYGPGFPFGSVLVIAAQGADVCMPHTLHTGTQVLQRFRPRFFPGGVLFRLCLWDWRLGQCNLELGLKIGLVDWILSFLVV